MEGSVSIAETSGAEGSIGEDVGVDSVGVGGKYSRSFLKIFGCGESSIVEDILYLGTVLPSTVLSDFPRTEAGNLHMLTLESIFIS